MSMDSTWRDLWEVAKPTTASQQSPLFDVELHAQVPSCAGSHYLYE